MKEFYEWLLGEIDVEGAYSLLTLGPCPSDGDEAIQISPDLAADPYTYLQVGLLMGESANDVMLHTTEDGELYCVHLNLKP